MKEQQVAINIVARNLLNKLELIFDPFVCLVVVV